jgi:hypothetical protein
MIRRLRKLVGGRSKEQMGESGQRYVLSTREPYFHVIDTQTGAESATAPRSTRRGDSQRRRTTEHGNTLENAPSFSLLRERR